MQTYEEFLSYVKEHILDFLPPQYADSEVSILPIHKNNNTLDGLTVLPNGVNIAPTVYLNGYYQDYVDGEVSLSIIMSRIATVISDNCMQESVDLNYLNDFEVVSGKIIPKVVGIENNEEYLANKIYTVKADLAVTFAIMLDRSDDGVQSIVITEQMANAGGTSAEVLEHVAKDNMNTLMPYTFDGMSKVLSKMVGPDGAEMMDIPLMDIENEMMFVLSNAERINGAAEIINEDAMNMVRDTLKSDFYILPSSVHEVLCIRASEDTDLSSLERMVQEVNETEVAPEDKLSNHVYKYDYDKQELYRADQEEQRQAELQEAQYRSATGR